MKHLQYPAIVLVFACLLSSCALSLFAQAPAHAGIPYPQPLPDTTAIRFLPGLVSKDSLDFNAMFSPDGQSFYFTRAASKITNIYISKYDGRQWTEPVLAPFTEGGYSDADPAFGPDGKLYFISNRPARRSDTLMDYDIWRVSPLAGGRWSEPENVKSINTDSAEYYISFTADGNLYFASSRPGGFGEEDIYVSRLEGQQYSQPENLGAAVNTDKSEYDPFISPKGDFLIFTSSNRGNSFGAADLYCSKLKGGKEWLRAANLGKSFNTSTREFCPYVSPDGKYFFFSSERDIKWISAGHLTRQMEKLW